MMHKSVMCLMALVASVGISHGQLVPANLKIRVEKADRISPLQLLARPQIVIGEKTTFSTRSILLPVLSTVIRQMDLGTLKVSLPPTQPVSYKEIRSTTWEEALPERYLPGFQIILRAVDIG